MIPVRLTLENFLSYTDAPPIDFGGFDVAAFTGTNGAGKSALLHALTWAVWGCARGSETGLNQERLINDAADAAKVEFVFELAGMRYRITRSRDRNGRSDLRFVVSDGADGWTNLAGESLRDTQARIDDVVRMDYRTFTASAFFVQGRADDFLSRMKAEDRKDVFARLLDLGVYDKLSDAARLRAREAEADRKRHAERIDALRLELAGAGDLERALEAALTARGDAERHAADAEAELRSRESELARLQSTLEVAAKQRAAVEGLRERVRAAEASVETRARELRDVAALIARRDEVAAALEEGERLTAEESEMQATALRRAEAETQRAETAGLLDAAVREVQTRLDGLRRRRDELDADLEIRRSLETELQKADAFMRQTSDAPRTVEEIGARLQDLRVRDSEIRAGIKALNEEGPAVDEKLELAKRGKGECPLCGQEFTPEHARRVVQEFTGRRKQIRQGLADAQAELKTVRDEGMRLKEEEERQRKIVAERMSIAERAAALRARFDEVPAMTRQIAELVTGIARLESSLRDDGVAAKERARLADIDALLAGLVYDRAAHAELRSRLKALDAVKAASVRIDEAVARLPILKRDREEAAVQLEHLRTDLEGAEDALETLAAQVEAEEMIRRRIVAAREAHEAAQRASVGAATSVARLEERLDALRKTAEELERARAAEQDAAGTHRRYQRLAQAFGRGGIPDRIIENALPELTEDANEILGRLTDYEMSVQFLMQKVTKTGGVRETFDVLVHHDGGVRDFQMFSGGEAFRIAFAIRLALSKLLVRRAGARLEMLVVDEGFGTQDAGGRERLLEVINLARTEFRKVLVITHLEDMKDAFGTQIRVTKTPRSGSRVSLSMSG